MTSTKRISDLESSVLYLENRNSELEEQVQKSVENNEKLSERLDLLGKFYFLQDVCGAEQQQNVLSCVCQKQN